MVETAYKKKTGGGLKKVCRENVYVTQMYFNSIDFGIQIEMTVSKSVFLHKRRKHPTSDGLPVAGGTYFSSRVW